MKDLVVVAVPYVGASDGRRIKQSAVQIVRESWVCGHCNLGEMVSTGSYKMCNPPLNEHECNQCGLKEDVSDAEFPRIVFVDAEVAPI